jgi:hypothetical protein
VGDHRRVVAKKIGSTCRKKAIPRCSEHHPAKTVQLANLLRLRDVVAIPEIFDFEDGVI